MVCFLTGYDWVRLQGPERGGGRRQPTCGFRIESKECSNLILEGDIGLRGKVTSLEEEKIGWNHLLSGHEFEQTPEDSEEQGSLTCCRS